MFQGEATTLTKRREPSVHPLEKCVRQEYATKIKYAHNSINNPKYPHKTKKHDVIEHYQFTIIGNFLSKEFLECVETANLFHRYKKNFDAPVIRGVTAIEWPVVVNEIKLRYGGDSYCLEDEVAVLINEKYLGGLNEFRNFLKTMFTYRVTIDYYNRAVQEFVNRVRSSGRPHAYMHITIDGNYIGAFIFMLYADLLPITCENFLRLCNLKRGGYNGTPVHRIVKDGWIQAGGFSLKKTDMPCENYNVPHDRRGVLCMANDGRNRDNSTQFFILLQPAKWMAHKYVAFGQLIDGEETLKKIENVPTFYESPLQNIIILDSGVLNMECQGIVATPGTNEFLEGHVEDLIKLGEILINELMQKVFMEIEFREFTRMQQKGEEVGEEIHETKRFLKNKEDIQEQFEKSNAEVETENSNAEYDVEVYEPEDYSYQHVSLKSSGIEVKEEKPYYIALTDVKYPGELDSVFDFKRFLKGYYCMEEDLVKKKEKEKVEESKENMKEHSSSGSSSNIGSGASDSSSGTSLDSDDENEIKTYLRFNVDHVSFAGEIIRDIAEREHKNKYRSHGISDAFLRKMRLTTFSKVSPKDRERKVLIKEEKNDDKPKTKRQNKHNENDLEFDEDVLIESIFEEDKPRKSPMKGVRITPSAQNQQSRAKINRRQTGFPAADISDISEVNMPRKSVLTRLYDDVAYDTEDDGPTLKDYKPITRGPRKNTLLTYSPVPYNRSDTSRDKFMQPSTSAERGMYNEMMTVQHGFERKISSDYIKTIEHFGRKSKNSIRSVEYARTRPSISIAEYQMKNQSPTFIDSNIK